MNRRCSGLWQLTIAAGLVLSAPAGPAAHEIPGDVTIHAFIKPDPQRLRLLVRVPLGAMRDVNFPTRGPGFVDMAAADEALRAAAWLWIGNAVEVYENDVRLPSPRLVAARMSLPSDRSFSSYAEALAHVTGARLPDDTALIWDQSLLDVLFEYPIQSDRSRLSVRPWFARLGLRVTTALRFVTPDGTVRAFEYVGDPGLVRLDPRWHQAALRFVSLGFLHILDGTDHLLFLLCLVVPFRRLRPLVLIVTSFTVAHSITLIASAFGLAPDALWFPPLVEALIALSILYMAIENIVSGISVRRRWLMTFGFGLVHGFGFSFALRETLQFAGSHLLTSLLSFNLGVEVGQLMVLALLVPSLQALFRYGVAERIGTIVLSALVAHTAWHWTVERVERLRQFDLPSFDAARLAMAIRWLIPSVIVAAIIWAARAFRARERAPRLP